MTASTLPTRTERSARSYAVLSIIAAVTTIILKLLAYFLTGSVGLLSDALESFINLAAAIVAYWALTVATRPPDAEHAYGHSKAEYIASATESLLIVGAAIGIGVTAWGRLVHPHRLENVWVGLAISMVAASINGGTAYVLLRAAKRLHSITLRADALHLMTDVWTSGGVVVAVALVQLTDWLILDPLIAFVVAANIVWMGVRILRDTADGVLDASIPRPDQELISGILSDYENLGVRFHALRTRAAGQRRFVELHVLVPGAWDVQRGHSLCEEIEQKIRAALPKSTVITHLEPLEDTVSWADEHIDRQAGRSTGRE